MKKFLALLLAAMMVLSAVPAMASEAPAANGDPTYTSGTGAATHNLVVDGAFTIAGLDQGDTVKLYRVLKFSETAAATGGWVADTGFTSLTEAQIKKILFIDSTGKQVDFTTANMTNYGIDEELAGTIADYAEGATAKYGANSTPTFSYAAGSDGKYTATLTGPEEGLYIAIITPAKAGTIYNPVFLGADYNNNTSNSWTIDLNDSYQPASMAKKETITLDKTATAQTKDGVNNSGDVVGTDPVPETVNVGDTVSFKVETTIPEFNDAYTKAVFKVTDSLSTGLELDVDSIKVYKDSISDTNLLRKGTSAERAAATPDGDYKLSTTTAGYTVDFYTQYILGLDAAQKIIITYDAEVTSSAPFSVNLEKNTVDVHFSNNPTDEEGRGRLRDETKHYTFDIDGNILGETPGKWPTTEVVKVGLDKDGKEIYQVTTTLHAGQTKVGALAGATFKLYKADTNGTLTIKDYQDNDVKLTQYTNSVLTANKLIESTNTGRLTIQGETNPGIRGLDIGTYYLVEEDAPTGYIKYQKAVKIEIIAPKPTTADENPTENAYWKLVSHADTTDPSITWNVWELKKYDVKIDGNQTASYTFTNSSAQAATYGEDGIISTKTDTITAADAAGLIGWEGVDDARAAYGKIRNTQGVELPSTGGTGTYMIYAIGAILVLLAGILLVSKRRAA